MSAPEIKGARGGFDAVVRELPVAVFLLMPFHVVISDLTQEDQGCAE